MLVRRRSPARATGRRSERAARVRGRRERTHAERGPRGVLTRRCEAGPRARRWRRSQPSGCWRQAGRARRTAAPATAPSTRRVDGEDAVEAGDREQLEDAVAGAHQRQRAAGFGRPRCGPRRGRRGRWSRGSRPRSGRRRPRRRRPVEQLGEAVAQRRRGVDVDLAADRDDGDRRPAGCETDSSTRVTASRRRRLRQITESGDADSQHATRPATACRRGGMTVRDAVTAAARAAARAASPPGESPVHARRATCPPAPARPCRLAGLGARPLRDAAGRARGRRAVGAPGRGGRARPRRVVGRGRHRHGVGQVARLPAARR